MTRSGQTKQKLTLKDRLSRLGYRRACRMLGPEGVKLIRKGGKYDIDIDAQVSLEADRLWLSLPETTVTVSDNVRTPGRLRVECLSCGGPCEHGGALLSLVLEEKMALGLAAPPPERVPVESLSEEALVARALEERRGRAKTERMAVRSRNPKSLWTDYLVTNRASGKTYRVALRGWSHGESYCSCPDFRKNTLGTCKHILHVQEKVRRRFPAASRNRPYRPKEIAVHLLYGSELQLHVLAPENGDKAVARLLRPFRNRPVEDIHGLLEAVRKLTARGEEVTIYPDAEEFINQQLFRERVTAAMKAIRRDPARHRLRKELLKAELLPYQLEGIAFAVGAGRAVLADDMGLGKTIQGIGVAEMLAVEAGIRKVLIICPTSLKSQWRSEIARFSGRESRLILGTAAERAEQYENDSFFTICNYEQVLRDILAIERASWDLIILDEGQRIKNWEAKTSRIIKGLKSPFALVLSGTPLENRLDDLFSIVEFIDDRRLGPAFRFFNHHRVADEKGRVLGYKNLDELRRRLKPVLLRRTRSSVKQQLPPRRTEVVRITPTEEQAELHNAHMQIVTWIIRKQYLTEMDLLRLQKALLMCRRAANATSLVDKKEPGYSSKLEHLDSLLGDLLAEEGRKILLFSEWTTMLDLIEPLLEKHAARYVRLDGSVPQRKRQGLVDAFQETPDCQVFITTNAGSTGLNLQAADTVINVDLPWNPAVLEQRISRAHRMGQKNRVQVFLLVTEGTIEENLLATLAAKHELALAALDPASDVRKVDLDSGMEALKRRLEVLLGEKPDAPMDMSLAEQEAGRLARRDRVSQAGGKLLGAAFSFLDELLPRREETEASRRMSAHLRDELGRLVEEDEKGRPRLTFTLPDKSALDNLAATLARLLTPPGDGRK